MARRLVGVVAKSRGSGKPRRRKTVVKSPHAPVYSYPTTYRGTVMRSKLEARWAGVLDAAGVRWCYEPEVLDVGKYGLYRPDFWLPELKTWLEVKGPHMERIEKTRQLARQLGRDGLVLVATAVGTAYRMSPSGRNPQAEVEVGRCECGVTAVGVPATGGQGRILCRACGAKTVPSHVLGW